MGRTSWLGLALLAFACGTKSGSGFSSNSKGPVDPDGGQSAFDDSGSSSFSGDGGHPPQGGCAPSPLNYDVPGNGCDDDADGTVDNAASCDTGLPVEGDAAAFARALGLCKTAGPSSWGVVSATYTNSYNPGGGPPADGQHGILGEFGNVIGPREGSAMGVLSTGWARTYDGPSGTEPFKGLHKIPMQSIFGVAFPNLGGAPPGYPRGSFNCGDIISALFDVVDVKLVIKVPANAQGFSFDFDFWSGEWPEYVCTPYNDAFVAFLSSKAFNGGTPDNISFDAKKNPVNVNIGFFDRCTPNTETGCCGAPGADPDAGSCPMQGTATASCPGGVSELAGTGFDDQGTYCGAKASTGGGATGWLTTHAPVQPGETITLDLMIWDTNDWEFDSSVLLDHIDWVPAPVQVGTDRPPR